MRNNLGGEDITVTPVLRAHDGAEFALSPVKISSNDIKSVDVSEAIVKEAPRLTGSYGSVVFRYRSRELRNLYAAVMVFDPGHPIAFHLDAFPQSTEYDAGSREGIWWLPNASAKDYLILTNQSQHPLRTTLYLYDSKGKSFRQPVALPPGTVTRYSVRELVQKAGLTGTYGGIKIEAKSGVASLDTTHVLFDETAGFSALMKMFDRDPHGEIEQRFGSPVEKYWTTRAPMLALTNPDPALGFPSDTVLRPEIFLRNTTSNPVTVSTRFNWHGEKGSGSAIGPTLRLRPDETQLLDVAALQKGRVIPIGAHWASVELTSLSRPNDIMAVAASYDTTLRYGTQTPFSDQLTFHWAGGEWQVDGTHNSIITTGNGGKIPVKAQLTISYDGGKKRYELEQELKPHEQLWVDMGKLIHGGLPDKNGSTLPPDLATGSYEIYDLTDRGIGNLFEGKITVDKTFGHAAYGCAECCAMQGNPYMYWDPIGVPTGFSGDQDVWDTDGCSGYDYSVLEYFNNGNWDTGSHSIATASYAVIQGVAGGATTDLASGSERIGTGLKFCHNLVENPSGGVNVGCPSSASASWTDQLGLNLLFPTLLTGIGNVSRVTVAPGSTSFDGEGVTETVSRSSNTCPSGFPNACVGSSTFTIGSSLQPQVCTAYNGTQCTQYTNVGNLLVGIHNEFFDQHTPTSPQSWLDVYGGSQCTQTCSQQYYCGNTKILDHTFTYTFQKQTMSGKSVTTVTLQ